MLSKKGESMRKIAIINQKGGSGKTTTTVNLAASLAEKKRKMLLIDLDAQASCTSWYGVDKGTKGIYPLFAENAAIGDVVVKTEFENIDLIPSSTWLVGIDKRLAQEVGSEMILKYQLDKVDSKKYDYVLIDCPPTLGILTVNALCAVNEVIVPVEARFMALNGLVHLLETIDIIKSRLNPSLAIAGIVPCRVDNRTKHAKEIVAELEKNFKNMLYKTAIRENVRLSEAPSFAKPITEYDKRSPGAYDYRSLAKEVIKQEKV
jgi:chromosome partitioning protein